MQMKEYCTDTMQCRHALLLAYFGERFAAGRCGNCCDNCLARRQNGVPVEDDIWLVCSRDCLFYAVRSWSTSALGVQGSFPQPMLLLIRRQLLRETLQLAFHWQQSRDAAQGHAFTDAV